jgi:hypothetical protein
MACYIPHVQCAEAMMVIGARLAEKRIIASVIFRYTEQRSEGLKLEAIFSPIERWMGDSCGLFRYWMKV